MKKDLTFFSTYFEYSKNIRIGIFNLLHFSRDKYLLFWTWVFTPKKRIVHDDFYLKNRETPHRMQPV